MRALVAASLAWLCLTSAAQACMGYNLHEGIVFDTIPEDAPADALVLRVEFDPADVQRIAGPHATDNTGDIRLVMRRVTMEARVLEVVRGEFSAPTVTVAVGGSSCDTPFIFGTSGLIIGRMVTPAAGQAQYDARHAEAQAQYDAWRASQPARTANTGDDDGPLVVPPRRPVWEFEETVFIPINENQDDRLERTTGVPIALPTTVSWFDPTTRTLRTGIIGDFDGVGRADLAGFRQVDDSIILEVILDSDPPHPIEIWRAPLNSAELFEISLAPPGDYPTACARYWQCDDDQRSNVSLRGNGIVLLALEGPAEFLYFWTGEAFDSELISE